MPRIPISEITLGLALFLALPALAVVEPDASDPWRAKELSHPALDIEPERARADLLPEGGLARADSLLDLGVDPRLARLDLRSGRWETLLLAEPLLPGSGKGNRLDWEALGSDGPAATEDLPRIAWQRFRSWVSEHRQALGIDPAELEGRATVDADGRMVRIHARRRIGKVLVEGSVLTAVVRHGNLVLFGTERWGNPELSPVPSVASAAARHEVQRHLEPFAVDGWRSAPRLLYVPTRPDIPGSDAYGYRLAWELDPETTHPLARWRAWVDAHSGELLRFFDTTHYFRQVQGGVFPISNDGQEPGGSEEAGYPMPFADVTSDTGLEFADSGGNAPDAQGEATTTLAGRYVRIDDVCGATFESTTTEILDLGEGPGTDCAVPPGGSPGNTHSARTAFYELNRIQETARAHLPDNAWLQQQLLAIPNRELSCAATYNGTAVTSSRISAACNNSGEIAAVWHHEFGHGLDDHDAAPGVSSPAGGIADLYAALRHNTSCIGRGFFLAGPCGGYGDPCLECDGVRDLDWAAHQSGVPHDVDWANTSCGGGDHCLGLLVGEAVWDLAQRDLQILYGQDPNTALEITTRLTYLGGGNVTTWFSGANGSAGCGATGGYLQFLAADDDNGDLADGTPHMQAIFDAFDRHGIACPTPAVQDSGCGDRPTVAPVVSATAGDRETRLSWDPVPGASRYKVYRTEGPLACDFGKIPSGETTATEVTVGALQNGREHYFVVAGFGTSDSCMGPASACTSVIPGTGGIFADGFESGDCSVWSGGGC